MKKRNIIAILASLAAVLLLFAACSGNNNEDDVTNPTVVGADGQVYQEVTELVTEVVTEIVTDVNGETVTDANGKVETKTEVVSQVVTVTKPVENQPVNGTTAGSVEGTTVEGVTTFEDVTFPEGEKVEVEVDKDGKPAESKMQKILSDTSKNKSFYLNATIVTNQNLGIVETGVPLKLYMKGTKFAFEMKLGLATMRMAFDGKSMNIILPETKYYYSVAAGEEGEMVEESMNIWGSIGSDTMGYVETTKVKLKGVEYICETYSDSTNTNKYYFNDKDELKRIEIIGADGTTTIFKVYECSSKVDDSIFSVPKGYKQLTEEALAGIFGNMGLTG